jgi:hypothetical protein
MSAENEKIHINIFKNNESQIEQSSNKSESYIILMNEDLNNKNRDYIIEIEQLTYQVNDLEEMNDKSEKSITYMRGLLKNIIGLKKLINEVNKIYKEHDKNILEINKCISNLVLNLNKSINILPIIYSIVIVLCFLMNISNLYNIIIQTFVIVITLLINFTYVNLDIRFILEYSKYNNSKNIIFSSTRKYINEKEEEIKKIEDANDFLNEYVDVI